MTEDIPQPVSPTPQRIHMAVGVGLALFLAVVTVTGALFLNNNSKDLRSRAADAAPAALPPQALYESCLISDASCVNHLDQMAAGGFKYVINYDQPYATLQQHIDYAHHADTLGMKVIWNIKDSDWWDTNQSNLKGDYSDLFANCTTCSTDTGSITYFINAVKGLPGTWGYYVGDETTASNYTNVKKFTDLVKQLDPSHPRLFISAEDCASNGKNLDLWVDTADVIGSDWYPWPRTDCPFQPTTNTIAAHIQQLATQNGKQSTYVVQSFSWAEYNESWVCTPFPSCANFPTVSQMQQEKAAVLSTMQPALLLWYSYFDVWNTASYNKIPAPRKTQAQYWADIVTAAGASGAPVITPTPAPSTNPTPTSIKPSATPSSTPFPTPKPTIKPVTTVTPTPIVSSTGGSTFGYSVVGSSTDNADGQQFTALRITVPKAGVAQKIGVYVGKLPKNAGRISAAIYSNTNGKPGSLLWGSSAQTLSNKGWNYVAVPNLSLNAGTYWVAVNASQLNTGFNFDQASTGVLVQEWLGSFGTWPQTAPQTNNNLQPYNYNITLTVTQ